MRRQHATCAQQDQDRAVKAYCENISLIIPLTTIFLAAAGGAKDAAAARDPVKTHATQLPGPEPGQAR